VTVGLSEDASHLQREKLAAWGRGESRRVEGVEEGESGETAEEEERESEMRWRG